jgi:hypothetical protein
MVKVPKASAERPPPVAEAVSAWPLVSRPLERNSYSIKFMLLQCFESIAGMRFTPISSAQSVQQYVNISDTLLVVFGHPRADRPPREQSRAKRS